MKEHRRHIYNRHTVGDRDYGSDVGWQEHRRKTTSGVRRDHTKYMLWAIFDCPKFDFHLLRSNSELDVELSSAKSTPGLNWYSARAHNRCVNESVGEQIGVLAMRRTSASEGSREVSDCKRCGMMKLTVDWRRDRDGARCSRVNVAQGVGDGLYPVQAYPMSSPASSNHLDLSYC
jgi:hypothetical protein